MTDNASPWEQFRPLAAPNINRQCQAFVSGLAYRGPDTWTGLAVTIVLAPAGMALEGAEGPRLVDTLGFRAFRGVVKPATVAGLLDAVQHGRIPSALLPEGVDLDIELSGRNGQGIRFFNPVFNNRNSDPPLLHYPHFLLEGSGDMVGDVVPEAVVSKLADALPTGEYPFAGFADLATELQLGRPPEHRSSRRVQIISPIWIGWDLVEPNIERGEIELRLHSYWDDPGDRLVLSTISRPDASPSWRSRSVVGGTEWESFEEDGVRRFSAVLKASGLLPPADMHLSFDGTKLDTFAVGLGSVRTIAHALFDPGFEQLRKRLDMPKNSDAYEEGVAWLMHLCGFSSVRYGHKDMQGATDVIAFRDASLALFAECTSKIPPLEKIVDLRSRADAFQRRIKTARGVSIVLARCMFVGVPKAELSKDLISKAHDEKVLLVSRDDIEDLLRGALRGEDAARAWGRITMCGPPTAPIHLE